MGTIENLTFFFVKAAANFAAAFPSIVSFSIVASLPLECRVAEPGMLLPQRGGGDWVLVNRQHSIHAPFEESVMHVLIMLTGAWSFLSSGKGIPFWHLGGGGRLKF